jgi:HEPN domain-containing protein
VNRRDFQTLAQTRLAESKALLEAGFPSGAYYLAGYAVECALKACIAKRTRRHDFPDKKEADASYTHNLKALIKAARLEEDHKLLSKTERAFRRNWDIVETWSEHVRYEFRDREAAEKMINAVSERGYGILPWVKRCW